MERRRWPDVVVVAGVLAFLVIGILALWGPDLKDWWSPPAKETEQVKHGSGVT
jgi:hypothetical protein